MNIKRILSIVLAIVMVLSTMSIGIVYAEETGVAYIYGKEGTYSNLEDAMNDAEKGDTIIL